MAQALLYTPPDTLPEEVRVGSQYRELKILLAARYLDRRRLDVSRPPRTASRWSCVPARRLPCDLDGQTENRIYVRTTFADQPKVPIDQIAMIDVGGDAINPSAEEVAQATGSAHYLIPRNGAPFRDSSSGSRGRSATPILKPPVFVFRKESGEEARILVSETRRLYLGNYTPPSTQSTSTSSPPNTPLAAGERQVVVVATADWVDTGLTVASGAGRHLHRVG